MNDPIPEVPAGNIFDALTGREKANFGQMAHKHL
jgi:hypothetical protein